MLKEETRHSSDDSDSDRNDEKASEVADRGRPRTHLATSESRNRPRLFPGHEPVQRAQPEAPKLADHARRQRRERHLRRKSDGRSSPKSRTVGSRRSGRPGEANHSRLQSIGVRVLDGGQTRNLESEIRRERSALRTPDEDRAVPRPRDARQLPQPDLRQIRRPENLLPPVQLGSI